MLRSKRGTKSWDLKFEGFNEEEFYKNIYGDSCEIIENINLREDVYKEINKSNLSVAFLTTAILEGYLYGHNCFYLNFHENNFYHKDFPQEIVLSKHNKSMMKLKIKDKIIDSKNRYKEIFEISRNKSLETLDNYRKKINDFMI